MSPAPGAVPRPRLDADIVVVGYGPAAAGFLTELSRMLSRPEAATVLPSAVAPGLPLQVLCYERADGLGFGVSGAATRARAIRASLPDFVPDAVPLCASIVREELVYLLDPHGASRRPVAWRGADRLLRAARLASDQAWRFPWIPSFLRKEPGLVLSLGQFLNWSADRLMALGTVQLWPSTPVAAPLFDGERVVGVRLADQGVARDGSPGPGFAPGPDVAAALTVVADGPAGPVGRALDDRFGLPSGHRRADWALGMKAVVELAPGSPLAPGVVVHTLGYPEPEIFGFAYGLPGGLASLGLFVPSTYRSPVRNAYDLLQHWMRHPYLARRLAGARLRSWGAKTLAESGREGEPHLAGDGFVRIGEGAGSTNVLAGAGVDEAWATGVVLAEGLRELAEAGRPWTRVNLEAAYVRRRRDHWVDREARAAAGARAGFAAGPTRGVLGIGLAGLTGGRARWPGRRDPRRRVRTLAEEFRGRIPPAEAERLRAEAYGRGVASHGMLARRAGWPAIELDGRLFMSQQDALLVGGKVQAPTGYADHVTVADPAACRACVDKVCVELCSAAALTPGPDGVPAFDREKCVHCGTCAWNCSSARPSDPGRGWLDFRAGAGGLHSAEN